MSKTRICLILLLLVPPTIGAQYGSSRQNADAIVAYDTTIQHLAAGATIPFDRHFVLSIPLRKGEKVKKVFVYCAYFKNGSRSLVTHGNPITGEQIAIPDMVLVPTPVKDSITINFPPLRPSINFDVAIVSALNGRSLATAYKLNEDLYNADFGSAVTRYKDLINLSSDDIESSSFFSYPELPDYISFYNTSLAGYYNQLHNPALYVYANFPNLSNVNYLSRQFNRLDVAFDDNKRLVEVLRDGYNNAVVAGLRTIKYDNTTDEDRETDYAARISNLSASLVFLDSLSRAIAACNAIALDSELVTIQAELTLVTEAMKQNKETIRSLFEKINDAIDQNENMRKGNVLIGTTVARDIKTQGGNVITLDAGVVCIWTRDSKARATYIPKPYYGINIYFRPIDKNTRKKDYPGHYPHDFISGPSNELPTVNTFWQHFSVNVGLTFGALPSTQYDYLFNSAVLMTGFGYRIGRFVKLNSGLSLLKRNSYNPVISEKKVIGGFYSSVSVDIDLIQGLKDFTSMIFK